MNATGSTVIRATHLPVKRSSYSSKSFIERRVARKTVEPVTFTDCVEEFQVGISMATGQPITVV
jgi:hypothetical protein